MKHSIVIVGSGTGGTLTANLLATDLALELHAGVAKIVLIGENDLHAFQPGNLDVAFQGAKPESFIREQEPLLHEVVQFLPEGAQRIDTDARVVITGSGREVPFDHLVLATGAVARLDLIPGLEGNALNFHQGPVVARHVWEALEGMQEGHLVVAITGTPYKCPPSPNESVFRADDYFRSRGIRDKIQITLVTPDPQAYPATSVADQIQPRLDECGVNVVSGFSVASVDGARQRLRAWDGREVPYDVLIAIPPHRGAPIVPISGLGDVDGFIPTDPQTMRVYGHDRIYALGDATNIRISKAGVVAHLQSLVVARNICADLHVEDGHWLYNGRTTCPMEVGDHKLLFVSGTYRDGPRADKPTHSKFAMKQVFNRMYWSVLSGSWEWLFKLYFGDTAEPDDHVEQANEANVGPSA